jgi:hypothetical protein
MRANAAAITAMIMATTQVVVEAMFTAKAATRYHPAGRQGEDLSLLTVSVSATSSKSVPTL